MIDFACRKFDLNEIIRCSLSLTKLEFRLLEFLLKHDQWLSASDISSELEIGLSTAQKGVKKLHDKAVLLQGQRNISGGGYFFTYRIANKPELRRIILGIVQNWTRKVESEIAKW